MVGLEPGLGVQVATNNSLPTEKLGRARRSRSDDGLKNGEAPHESSVNGPAISVGIARSHGFDGEISGGTTESSVALMSMSTCVFTSDTL